MNPSWAHDGRSGCGGESRRLLERRNRWGDMCTYLTDGKRAFIVLYCLTLIMLLAAERFTFKVMVDRMAPFRFVLTQAVSLCYFMAVGVVVIRKVKLQELSAHMEGLPKWKLLIMATLDLCHLVPMIVSATEVAPTLTVLLLQCLEPFCHAISCAFCGRGYTAKSALGAGVILVGTLVAMFLPMYRLYLALGLGKQQQLLDNDETGSWNEELAQVEAYNTLLYMAACVPAAVSTVYKQHVLENYELPVDSHQLSLAVTSFEMILILLASPVAYQMQNLGIREPSNPTLGVSLVDGWRCWALMESVEDPDRYSSEAQCAGGLPLVVAYVIATLLVNFTVQRVVDITESPSLYYHTTTWSVPAAFIALSFYKEEKWLHDNVNAFTVAGLLIIMVGLHFCHAGSEPEVQLTFTPVSPDCKRPGWDQSDFGSLNQ
ncbi:unnamed protein product [Discosporangium mesarthrocarpum]